MFGFFFGTLCLFGLFKLARHSACHRRYGCHGAGGWGGHRGRRGRFQGDRLNAAYARAAGEVFKRRLDIDEEQELIVDHAITDAHKALDELAKELRDTRASLADAVRGETVDDAALAAAFSRHDDALGRTRRQVVSAARQIHAVLDADQRQQVADWLAKGEGRWF